MPAGRPSGSSRRRRRPTRHPSRCRARWRARSPRTIRRPGWCRAGGVGGETPGRAAVPPRPSGVVYRTELPSGPSVTTRIETCQATSSRSSSVSHSWRLQLRTSIDLAKLESGQSRSSTFRIAGAKKRTPAPAAPSTRAARRLGKEATTRRSHGRAALASNASGCQGRVTAAKADRQLVAKLAARDEQGPIGGVIEHANRVVKNAKIGQPLRDRLARRVGLRSQSATRAGPRARRRSLLPFRRGRHARRARAPTGVR